MPLEDSAPCMKLKKANGARLGQPFVEMASDLM